MHITTRLKVISTATTVGLVVLSSLLFWTFTGFKAAERDKALADRILVNFFERASFRDQYFLYREERTRKQWDNNREEAERLLSQAAAQFHNAEDQQTLARLHEHIKESATVFHRIVDNTRAMQTAGSGKRPIYAELDRRLSSQLLMKGTSVQDAATTLYEASSHRVDHAYQRLFIVAGAFAVSVALLTILAAISLGRLIRRRLIPLHDGARIIARGDLAHRIEFDTHDEFAELARSINTMTDRLQAFTHKLETEIAERKHAESALQKSNELLQSVVQNVPAGIFWKDRDSRYLGCNTQFAQEAGYTGPEQIIGKRDFDLVWAAQADAYRADDKATMESGIAKLDYEEPHTIHNGKTLWVRTSKVPLRDENNQVIGVLGIYQDITERKQAEDALRESENRFRTMANNAPVLIWMAGLDKLCNWFNKVWLDFTGRSMEQEMGNGWAEGVHPEDMQRCLDTYVTAFDARQEFIMEYRLRRHDGAYRWLSDHGIPRFDDQGVFLGYIGSCVDITERRAAEEQAQHRAHYDPLTELPNRTLFSDRLQQALAIAKRDQTQLALMFVDLDRFKLINDELGHHVGDLLLKEVAKRMQGCVRESDTVARIGGDEFVMVLPSIESEHDARVVAEKIREAISRPFALAGNNLETSLSVGISVYPQHGRDETQLVKNADTAMYLAKQSGRNNVVVYQTGTAAVQ
ncbi:MAG TPA: diguanylate cyclase [Sideroxyarcus sp.]|nr:diguanylate cyclase [Sideroxyarcus sp.]